MFQEFTKNWPAAEKPKAMINKTNFIQLSAEKYKKKMIKEKRVKTRGQTIKEVILTFHYLLCHSRYVCSATQEIKTKKWRQRYVHEAHVRFSQMTAAIHNMKSFHKQRF